MKQINENGRKLWWAMLGLPGSNNGQQKEVWKQSRERKEKCGRYLQSLEPSLKWGEVAISGAEGRAVVWRHRPGSKQTIYGAD